MAQAVDQLQMTTRIARGDDGCPGCFNIGDLALLQHRGSGRLRDIVNPGATAAPVGLREFG